MLGIEAAVFRGGTALDKNWQALERLFAEVLIMKTFAGF